MASVTLPATVTDVDERAFRSSDVANVTVADGNPSLSSYDGALYDATRSSLLLIPGGRQGAVRIPSQAADVPASAFSHCALVTAISVDAGGAHLSSWEGLLYDADGTTLLRVPAGATEIAIREGCTAIAAGALEACASLERINAPSTVTSISPDVLTAIPTVSLLAASLAGADDPGTAGEPSSQEAALQLTAMVALSTTDDDLPEMQPSSIAVTLPAGSQEDAWKNGGFSVSAKTSDAQLFEVQEGENADIEPPAVASTQSAETYSASNVVLDANGGRFTGTYQRAISGGGTSSAVWAPGETKTYSNLSSPFEYSFNVSSAIYSAGAVHFWTNTSWNWPDGLTSQYGCWFVALAPYKEGYTFTGWHKGSLTGPHVTGSAIPIAAGDKYYASWTPTIYTVTLDHAGGKVGTSTAKGTIYLKYGIGWYSNAAATTGITKVTVPTRSGYTFGGYKGTDKSGVSRTYVDSSGSLKNSSTYWSHFVSNTTLTAQWTKKASHAVTLNKNNGTGGTSTVYYWPDKGYTTSSTSTTVVSTGGALVSSLPTRAGYTFAGYYSSTASNATQYVTSAGKLTSSASALTSTATWYAHWTKKTSHAVTLNKNNGTGGTATVYYWPEKGYTTSSTSTTVIASGSKLISSLPVRSGYAFAGYCSSTASNATQYVTSAGMLTSSAPVLSANATWYARWNSGIYKVNLNNQTATSAGTAAIYEKYATGWYSSSAATTKITSITVPKRTGYTFGGYYTETGGKGTKRIDAEGSILASSTDYADDGILYAFWTTPYSATIDPNGGTISIYDTFDGFPDDHLLESGKPATTIKWDGPQQIYGVSGGCAHVVLGSLIRNYRVVRPGYTFDGWSGTHPVSTAQSVQMKPGTTYTALWKANTYEVSFNPNGGAGGQSDAVMATYGSAMPTISATPPKRDGYTFLGWYDDADYTKGEQYYTAAGASARKYDKASTTALYAGWSKWPSMSLDANGGFFKIVNSSTGEVVAQDQTSWTTDFAPSAAVYPGVVHYWRDGYLFVVYVGRPGYTIQGWTGSRPVNSSTGVVSVRNGESYKADWKASPYTIAFDTQCDLDVADVSATYDQDVTLPAPPERKGYIFNGWNTEADGSGELYEAGVALEKPNLAESGTMTLYAQWRAAISADAPVDATVRVDLLGIEDQAMEPGKEGYIESRSGAPLKVESVAFTREAGAEQLFGSSFGQVSLQALAGDDASWATGTPAFSFALDAAGADAVEDDEVKLAPFAMAGYEERIPISYRFAIPSDVLAAIDPARFEQVTTSVCSVVYTVALQNPPQGPSA